MEPLNTTAPGLHHRNQAVSGEDSGGKRRSPSVERIGSRGSYQGESGGTVSGEGKMFNISHSPPPYFFGSTPWPGANFSFSPSIETLDTFADLHALKSQQPAAQHLWYGAHAQRLREMPSGAHSQPSGWVRPEPKRQPKTHRGQDRPLQSHRQSQLQGAVVSDDTFHASAWEVAGNSGGLLVRLCGPAQSHISLCFRIAPPRDLRTDDSG